MCFPPPPKKRSYRFFWKEKRSEPSSGFHMTGAIIWQVDFSFQWEFQTPLNGVNMCFASEKCLFFYRFCHLNRFPDFITSPLAPTSRTKILLLPYLPTLVLAHICLPHGVFKQLKPYWKPEKNRLKSSKWIFWVLIKNPSDFARQEFRSKEKKLGIDICSSFWFHFQRGCIVPWAKKKAPPGRLAR